jgi:hypothetical protein
MRQAATTLGVLVRAVLLLSRPIFNMDTYAIIDNAGGWIVNTCLWDGNVETWQPPEGTSARLLAEVDLEALPQKPQDPSVTTPEAWVSQHFSAMQVSALQRFEFALLQAGKPLGANMTVLKAWMEAMLVASVDPTARTFPAPPCSYEAASAEAVAGMQS